MIDDIVHIKGPVLIVGNQLFQAFGLLKGLLGLCFRRILAAVRREIRQIVLAKVDGLFFVVDEDIAAARLLAVELGAAHLLEGHLFADDHLRHAR